MDGRGGGLQVKTANSARKDGAESCNVVVLQLVSQLAKNALMVSSVQEFATSSTRRWSQERPWPRDWKALAFWQISN
jgi:hypothetical protein